MRWREQQVRKLNVLDRSTGLLVEYSALGARVCKGYKERDQSMQDWCARLRPRLAGVVFALDMCCVALNLVCQFGLLDVLDKLKHVDLVDALRPSQVVCVHSSVLLLSWN